MNQEYILLGGLIWKILGKKIYMWRNHHAGSFLTDIAAMFCEKVFCTSKFSYTAKYKKTAILPVGVNTEIFKPSSGIRRVPHSILFLARMAKVKKPHILIQALQILRTRGLDFTASFYGDPIPADDTYYQSLKTQVAKSDLTDRITSYKGLPNAETVAIYNAHEIFVNLSSSGMYDKTIFGAMACGCFTLASNENLRGNIDSRMVIPQRTPEQVAEKLAAVLEMPAAEKKKISDEEIKFAKTQSLNALSQKLYEMICIV